MLSTSQLSEVAGAPLKIRDSVFANYETSLQDDPDAVAVIAAHQPADYLAALTIKDGEEQQRSKQSSDNGTSCLSWTYAQLLRASLKTSQGLSFLGVKPGMQMATFLPNGVEICITNWTGAVFRVAEANLDPGALSGPRRAELVSFMKRVKPDVVFVQYRSGAEAIDNALAKAGIPVPKVRVVIDQAEAAPGGWHTLIEVAALGDANPVDEELLLQDARQDDPDRIACIFFTSGTSTGNPKGVPHTVRSFVSGQEQLNPVDCFLPGQTRPRMLVTTANFRVIYSVATYGMWTNTGTLVFPGPSFTLDGALDAIHKYKATWMILIPTMLHMFAKHPKTASTDLSSLMSISYGGDVVTRDTMEKSRVLFPSANPTIGYGMTEGTGLINWPYLAPGAGQIEYYQDMAPLGVIAPGARAKILDLATGQTTRRGEHGELVISHGGMTSGYLENAHADLFHMEDGRQWFKTGDLGLINDDGLVYIIGRIKDIVKRAGIPISPAALENCIEQHINSHTVIIGVPHPELGQDPYAVVQDLKDSTPEAVQTLILQKFGPDYRLGGVVTLEQLGWNAFPLNPTAKVMKPVVAEKLLHYLRGH